MQKLDGMSTLSAMGYHLAAGNRRRLGDVRARLLADHNGAGNGFMRPDSARGVCRRGADPCQVVQSDTRPRLAAACDVHYI